MRLAASLLCVALVQAVLPTRDAPSTAPPRPTGTAIIRGRVVAADTGTPIRRALVTVAGDARGRGRGVILTIYTDAQGRYEARDLPAGWYFVRARPNQYQGQYLEQPIPPSTPPDGPPRLPLAEGQLVQGYDLALPRAAAIVGRIVDENGDPVSGVGVRLLRPGDRSEFGNYSAQSSDELGRYRLFHLTPGEYQIVVKPSGGGDMLPPGEGRSLGFVETYYPGTPSREEAGRVRARAGQETAVGDLQLTRARMLSVKGTVLDSQGAPPPSRTMVSLVRDGGSSGVGVGPTGRFTFYQPQPPGTYRLIARLPDESGEGTIEYGSLAFTLVDSDLDDLVLPMKATVNLAGRVVFDTAVPPVLRGDALAIGAQPKDRSVNTQLFLRPATVGPDLTFTLRRLAGELLLRSNGGLMPGWYLKAVLLGDRDITDVPTEFTADDSGRVRLVFTNRASELSGNVTDDKGDPVKFCNVVLFSEDRAVWFASSSRVRANFPQGGRYNMKGLKPGRYYVIALPSERRINEQTMDAATLEALVREATALVLGEDEQRVVDLKLAATGGGH